MALVPSAGQRRLALWVVCGLTLLALVFRLSFMDAPMRGDEAWSFTAFASKPLTEGLSSYWAFNNHLLNTLLMHLAYVTFGNEPLWLRLPALFPGVLLVPTTYAAGRAFYGAAAGMLAAALVAASSALIEYSTNARGYMLLTLAFLLLLALAKRLYRRGQRRDWAAFAVIAALGFYAVPTMSYAFAVVAGWLGLTWLVERQWRRIGALVAACVGTALLTLLLYAPSLLYLARLDPATPTNFENASSLTAAEFFGSLGRVLAGLWDGSWARDWPTVARVIIAAGFVLGLVLHRRLARDPIPLGLAALVTLTPILIVQRPDILARVWLFLLPLFLIVSAAGLIAALTLIARRPGLTTAAAVAALVVGVGLGGWTARKTSIYADRETGYDMQHPAQILDALRAQVAPGDMVITCPTCLDVLNYYADREGKPLDTTTYLTPVGAWRPHTLPSTPPARVLIVTSYLLEPAQAKAEMLAPFGLDLSRYSTPELLGTFDSNQIYRSRHIG